MVDVRVSRGGLGGKGRSVNGGGMVVVGRIGSLPDLVERDAREEEGRDQRT